MGSGAFILLSSVANHDAPRACATCNNTASVRSMFSASAVFMAANAVAISTAMTSIGPAANWANFCETKAPSTPYTFTRIALASKRVKVVVNQPVWRRMNCSQPLEAG